MSVQLYKIHERHCAPKGCVEFIRLYVIADNREQVYNYCKKEYYWFEDLEWELEDDDDLTPEEIEEEIKLSRERYMKNGGEFFDDAASYADAYYGVSHQGFEFFKDISEEDAKILIDLKIAKDVR